MATMPSANTTVASTAPLSVVVSSLVPTPSLQTQQAPLAGSPKIRALQLATLEEDPFAHGRRTTSVKNVAPLASSIVATTETVRRKLSKENSKATIPLEGKEVKRRERDRKEENKSGRTDHEKHLPRRRRDDPYSTAEREQKANDVKSLSRILAIGRLLTQDYQERAV